MAKQRNHLITRPSISSTPLVAAVLFIVHRLGIVLCLLLNPVTVPGITALALGEAVDLSANNASDDVLSGSVIVGGFYRYNVILVVSFFVVEALR